MQINPASAWEIRPGTFDSLFDDGLTGCAARGVANTLLAEWQVALVAGSTANLVHNVRDVLVQLQEFESFAQRHLPVKNGGLQGHPESDWLVLLSEHDVSVYEAEDLPGHFGYTGCEADDYMSFDEALAAAVQATIPTRLHDHFLRTI